MVNNAFIELTNDKMIDRIEIDPRLIDSFKRVMKKMGIYFAAHGYTDIKDYKEFFEKYLLRNDNNYMNISILLNDEPEKLGATGVYFKGKNSICVSRSLYERCMKTGSYESLDHTLFHEFVHFIVMHELTPQNSDRQFYYGGFMNEAFTEMFTIENYKQDSSYVPQVSMMKFANLVTGTVNNFREFLKGRIDPNMYTQKNKLLYDMLDKYQAKFENTGYKMYEAEKDLDYLSAQRFLIAEFLNVNYVTSIEKYFEFYDMIEQRPVSDTEHVASHYNMMEDNLISRTVSNETSLKPYFKKLFKELHEIGDKVRMYQDQSVYEFDFDEYHLAVTPDGKVIGGFYQHDGNKAQYSSMPPIVHFQTINGTLDLNLNSLVYTNYQEKLNNHKAEMTSLIKKTTVKDIDAVKKVAGTDKELIRLERFTLPVIGLEKKNPKTVYIAYYSTGTQVLTDYPSLGTTESVNVDKYVGLTSTNLAQALIVRETIADNAPGIIYTTASKTYVNNLAKNLVLKQMEENLSPEDKEKVYQAYKNSEEYYEADSEEYSREESLDWYARLRLNALDESKREKLYTLFKNQADKFIVTTINGVVSVAKLETPNVAYIAEKEVLIDTRYPSFYNDYYQEERKKHLASVTNDELITELENGELVVDSTPVDISSKSVESILDETRAMEGLTEEVRSRLL